MAGRAFLTILSMLLAASVVSAQSRQGPPVMLSAAQQERLAAVVLANPEIRRLVGPGARVYFSTPEFDKEATEAFLNGSTDVPPRPLVNVLAVSPRGAARARVALDNGRAVRVEPVAAVDVPILDEDVARALALAQRSARTGIRMGPMLERFQPARAGVEYPPTAYIAEPLPLRSSNPRDPCSRDRCLELVFRTPQGYLPLRIQVNLTRGRAIPVGPTVEQHR
jgi:hypothetical protein